MDFKLDYGPWEKIFVGQTYGHEVEIVSNPEHFFLVLIYDIKDNKKLGAVIEGYKAFYARGQLEPFIQTLPKPSFGIEKNMGNKTGKIFFISFEPFYVDFHQEDYERKIDLAINKIYENSTTIIDLARASALDLLDLSTVPKADYTPILGDPFFIKTLIGGQREPELARIDLTKSIMTEKEPVIQLGLSKTREIIKEPIENLMRTQIIGKTQGANYALYILAENFLLENCPLIIFDSIDYFDSIGTGTQDPFDLRDQLVDFEPMGFPMRQYIAKETIKVSLKNADIFYILDLLGMNDPEFQKNLALLTISLRADTPEELVDKILQTRDLSDYDKLKAERTINTINIILKDLFGTETPTTDLTKLIPGKIARAVIIDTKKLNKLEKIVFMHTTIRQVSRGYSETQKTNCAIILPEASILFEDEPEKASTAIQRLENRGVGVLLASEKPLPEELDKTLTAKINIINGKDAAVIIKSKRNYRVQLRPSLSGTPKAE